jgi:hypothetical protein
MKFRLDFLLPLLAALSTLSEALPVLRRRDADIESLYGITRLNRDHSGKKGDPYKKYFHESTVSLSKHGSFRS